MYDNKLSRYIVVRVVVELAAVALACFVGEHKYKGKLIIPFNKVAHSRGLIQRRSSKGLIKR